MIPLLIRILATLKSILESGLLRMPHHKLVFTIGGAYDSTEETKLYKSAKVIYLISLTF